MQDKAHAALLKEEFLRSLMASTLAPSCAVPRARARKPLSAPCFRTWGACWPLYYFPEEARADPHPVQAPRDAVSEPLPRAGCWAWLRRTGPGMRGPGPCPQRSSGCARARRRTVGPTHADPTERMRWIAAASNAIADTLLRGEAQGQDARARPGQYAPAMGVRMQAVSDATTKARQKLVEMAQAMDIRVAPGSAAAQLLTVALQRARLTPPMATPRCSAPNCRPPRSNSRRPRAVPRRTARR